MLKSKLHIPKTMIKTILAALLVFVYTVTAAQTKKSTFNFLHTYYNENGSIFKTDKKSLTSAKILDLPFYRKHFNKPYYFPGKFIDKVYKNQTIEIPQYSTKSKYAASNWYYSYVFDSSSRVVLYSYSSCITCSTLPFNIEIIYDNTGRPNKLLFRYSSDRHSPEIHRYELTYDNKGNIILIKYITGGHLTEQIEII